MEERTVRGESMAGIAEEGDAVKLLTGYYNCNPIQRGDIVAYSYGRDNKILMKRAEGIPGDRFIVADSGNESGRLLINGEPLKTADGKEFILDSQQKHILAMYADSYQSTVPEGAYLIFGNVAEGSVDSTKFGLVGKQDIVGKIIVP